MAKKVVQAAVNLRLLQGIASGNVKYINAIDAGPLMAHNPPLIETNPDPSTFNSDGSRLVRLTEAGTAMIAPKSGSVAAPSGGFEIITNAVLPAAKKRGKNGGAGAPTMYPWDKMEVGNTFFVPKSVETPDPFKKLSSAVSSANMKYSVETGETKTVTRAKRDGRKTAVDANGQKIMETVDRLIMRRERKFSVWSVKAGEVHGGWTATADGVLVRRDS